MTETFLEQKTKRDKSFNKSLINNSGNPRVNLGYWEHRKNLIKNLRIMLLGWKKLAGVLKQLVEI